MFRVLSEAANRTSEHEGSFLHRYFGLLGDLLTLGAPLVCWLLLSSVEVKIKGCDVVF